MEIGASLNQKVKVYRLYNLLVFILCTEYFIQDCFSRDIVIRIRELDSYHWVTIQE
jgi:hypothetical protein